ncbi:28S ribosomal protein S5, mitochondrial [Malassezia vespertilionis]|uniref:28S ribosomal protein S5, mitochondrial n=1 Tax=Malassezia vespertilionis TaxID=2020962 RepID=UPI0024B108A2|nr:28S ribosomal protein S5, mitochondrial [Malassezia vespertilionis]WFD06741.1 28S ribosomal protein S5, mitochondrial [Malassezia vespertilionis]
MGVRFIASKADEPVHVHEKESVSQGSGASASAMQRALPLVFSRIDLEQFPRLLQKHDPILDGAQGDVMRKDPDEQNPFGSSVAVYNDGDKHFPTPPPAIQAVMRASGGAGEEVNSESYLSSVTPLTAPEVQALHRYNIKLKRVVNMTGKGRVASWYALVVAGNGRGLVGYGEGKDTNAGRANKKAFHAAAKNMDLVAVHRAKSGSNTVETTVEGHWSATRVVIRPRPAGFGLRVPDVIHPIARAAGFTDLNAAIYGSTNAMNVVKATFQVLWGGSAPIGMGGGVRGKMRRNDKGQGALSRRDMELSRGRKLEELDMFR